MSPKADYSCNRFMFHELVKRETALMNQVVFWVPVRAIYE